MSLADARVARDAARAALRAPKPESVPAAPGFEEAARAWHPGQCAPLERGHAERVLAALEAEVFPAVGALPVDAILPAELLAVLRPLEERGAVETARRIKQRCARIFAYSIACGWAVANPAASLGDALAPLPAKGRRPAVTTLEEARALIRAIDAATAHPATKLALRFVALTAQRPGEVAGMRWDELHGAGDAAEWRIPAERMKMQVAHVVPLVPAAVACLEAMRPLSGRGRYLFPGAFDMGSPMSENAMGSMLIRLGYRNRHVPHGWRATFSTIMNERYPADRAAIDLMLAHVPKDAVERAYNRAEHQVRRRALAQAWAELLLEGAAPAENLVPGRRRR